MTPRRLALALLLLLVCARPAAAQNGGFQLNRYEPTAAGEWSLLIDHPWYSSTRYLAAGLTLNYARNPLVSGSRDLFGNFTREGAIISDQLLMHVDLAGSFLDRVLLTASLPVILLERGQAAEGITPLGGAAVGDLRLGAMGRLYGQPYRGPFSLHLGVSVFVPFGAFPPQVGETGVRVLPRLIAAGYTHRVLYSAMVGFYYRPRQSLGDLAGDGLNEVGSALQLGVAIAYADPRRGFAVGPEVLLNTSVIGAPFRLYRTSLELLFGAHYKVGRFVQLSLGGGVGFLSEPGTPDGRVLFRTAFAPDRVARKAPPPDRDRDGVEDLLDECPGEAAGPVPDPARRGCPRALLVLDGDRDGVPDPDDRCPGVPAGPRPAAAKDRRGCPDRDTDKDGVYDGEDQCPGEAAGARPDPARRGCPVRDQDGDGVADGEDPCPGEAPGLYPDGARRGCPATLGRGAALRARALAAVQGGLKETARPLRLRALWAAAGEAALLKEVQRQLGEPDLTLPLLRILGRRGVREARGELAALLARTQDLKVYISTATTLAQLGDDEGRKRLREAQKAKDEDARLRAALALATLEERPALKPLRRLIGSGNGLPEDLLLDGLTQLARAGDGAAADRLRGFLTAQLSSTEPRLLAARALLAGKDRAAELQLRQMMTEGGLGRLFAARALAEQGDEAACKLLTESAPREREPAGQILIAEGLAGCGAADTDALAYLLDLAGAQGELHMAAAAAILARVPAGAADAAAGEARPAAPPPTGQGQPPPGAARAALARALEVLRRGLSSGASGARLVALRAAAGRPELSAEVLRLLDDPSLQGEAALLLGQAGVAQASAPIRALLENTKDATTFVLSAEALARLGDSLGRKRLGEAQKAKDPTMKLRAVLGLARLGDGKARKGLKKLAARPGPGTEVLAAEALGELGRAGDRKAPAQLLAILAGAGGEDLKMAAARAIAATGDAAGQKALRSALQQGGAARLAAARALGASGDDEACRALGAVLRDGQGGAGRVVAAEGLGRCGAAADAAALGSLLEDGGAPEELRVAVAGALLQLGPAAAAAVAGSAGPAAAPGAQAPPVEAGPAATPGAQAPPAGAGPAAAPGAADRARALEIVRQGLGSAARGTRLLALRGAVAEPTLLAEVTRKLGEADLQLEAARLLGEAGRKEASAEVGALLERTTDAAVFVGSAEALARLGDPKGRKRLQEAQKAKDPIMKLAATLSLSRLGDRGAQKRLRKLADGTPSAGPELRLQAQGELGRQGDRAAREQLLAQISSAGTEELRGLAARELARGEDAESLGRLRALLLDGGGRRAAAPALAERGEPEACRVLAELSQDRKAPLPAAALLGLGACGPAAGPLATRLTDPALSEELRVAIAAALLRIAR